MVQIIKVFKSLKKLFWLQPCKISIASNFWIQCVSQKLIHKKNQMSLSWICFKKFDRNSVSTSTVLPVNTSPHPLLSLISLWKNTRSNQVRCDAFTQMINNKNFSFSSNIFVTIWCKSLNEKRNTWKSKQTQISKGKTKQI